MFDMREEGIDLEDMVESGRICPSKHPIWIVAEGYGLCMCTFDGNIAPDIWTAWRFTPPTRWNHWRTFGSLYFAEFSSKEEALEHIQYDMNLYRTAGFSEEMERKRLMPV